MAYVTNEDVAKILRFNGITHEGYQLYCLRIKEALRAKRIIRTLTNDKVDQTGSDQKLSVIVCSLGNNPLKVIQSCQTLKANCERFNLRYPGRAVINKMGMLNSLLNIKHSKGEGIGNRIATMETKLARLASMNWVVKDSMKIALPILSIRHSRGFEVISASINSMKEDDLSKELCDKYIPGRTGKARQQKRPKYT